MTKDTEKKGYARNHIFLGVIIGSISGLISGLLVLFVGWLLSDLPKEFRRSNIISTHIERADQLLQEDILYPVEIGGRPSISN